MKRNGTVETEIDPELTPIPVSGVAPLELVTRHLALMEYRLSRVERSIGKLGGAVLTAAGTVVASLLVQWLTRK